MNKCTIRYNKDRIAPTEIDSYFRHQIIQGMFMIWELQWKVELVDMPEFFSNSMDVAKIMQLYLQKEITGTSNISENIR
jgi:hypothetical protein